MDITLTDQTGTANQQQCNLVTAILDFAGRQLGLPGDTEMSVTFMNNQQIQAINRTYRQIDRPTDVISFAIEEQGEDELAIIAPETFQLPRNLGDIMISLEKTQEQAEEYGHSFERELGFLAIHGFLHLNGYDHQEPDEEAEMFALQRKILADYGLER